MDTYENDFNPIQGEQESDIFTKKPDKVSPFADSFYQTPFSQTEYYTPPVKKKKSAGKVFKRILSIFLVLCLVAASCGATAYFLNRYWQEKTNLANLAVNNRFQVMQNQIDNLLQNNTAADEEETDGVSYSPAQVYTQCVDAVVAVHSQSSAGSGFVISADGYIVSNYHVVEGATTLSVTTTAGKEYAAKLVGYEEVNDIALLKVEAADLPFVKLGSSDSLVVGEKVVAIGNPLGELTSTLTVGYISAKDRVVTTDGSSLNMLQTDAAINAGNSGGPLFNMLGEVVGIITAKYSGETDAGVTIEGIGFAIPISDVADMLSDLQEFGYIKSTYLGVSVRDVDASVIQNYGFPAGAYVASVVEGGSAHRAGIQNKDIIVNIGGYPVNSISSLTRVLQKFEPGQETVITVYRGGAQLDLPITLDEKPQQTETEEPDNNSTQEQPNSWWDGFFPPFFGWD